MKRFEDTTPHLSMEPVSLPLPQTLLEKSLLSKSFVMNAFDSVILFLSSNGTLLLLCLLDSLSVNCVSSFYTACIEIVTVYMIIGKIGTNCTPGSAIKSLRAQTCFSSEKIFCFYVYFTYKIIIAQLSCS